MSMECGCRGSKPGGYVLIAPVDSNHGIAVSLLLRTICCCGQYQRRVPNACKFYMYVRGGYPNFADVTIAFFDHNAAVRKVCRCIVPLLITRYYHRHEPFRGNNISRRRSIVWSKSRHLLKESMWISFGRPDIQIYPLTHYCRLEYDILFA